ncbi:beta-ketoacyl synthase N-terminal-like domain-containing protein [Rhodococcus sp. H29-C3]|uniref:type I polyketide synthase n=1 Tax=Rhodococcus sp. H29-C3 TaxID=3046307 RepID=UPI0024B9F4A3|nr:beta-ketoacyl synthase N-terminal-like domain-containing protein [Rhodococcus sp. H29-C3]MDJ0360833.1 beta-ketoacyl synthase N-terminal-like domain-containing protein [Rhodococcus sp. H29-C3]
MTSDPAIAVTGIACRFPGASDASAFWKLLLDGRHGASEVPPDRWTTDDWTNGSDAPRPPSRFGGFITGHSNFDHAFFGVSPAEASEMDVQQRLILEMAWHAIEDAGIDPTALAGSTTGVFVGMMSSDWTSMAMSSPAEMTPHRGTGGGYCMAANRVSYHLDLHGPSMTVDTACSSSLVAIHQAASAIRAGDIDTAIVAGANMMLSPALSVFYAESGLASTDGRCKPFSAGADGIGRGEGIGVVVLQRETDAITRSGLSYARILASAVNHDGRSNGISAPSMWSQIAVLESAYARASVNAADVDFVEGHGTGTVLGDMIESRALGKVLGVERSRPCLLGSVKGNVGHLEGAAGIAGFIKAILSIKNRVLPPSLFADAENEALGLSGKGMRLNDSIAKLPRTPIVGGISSFGMGGTNAHVVVGSPTDVRSPSRLSGTSVLTISANDDSALTSNVTALADFVDGVSPDRFNQIAYSTNIVKTGLRSRIAVAADTPSQGAAALRRAVLLRSGTASGRTPAPAFLFTGQGSQYPAMGRALERRCPVYSDRLREVVDAAADDLRPHLDRVLFDEDSAELVARAAIAQPALFAVQYALSAAFVDVGVRPVAVLGHSLGEFAASVTAGALTMSDALGLVSMRGTPMDSAAGAGGMLSVRADVSTIVAHVELDSTLCIAAINGPGSTVLAGATEALERAERVLAAYSPKRQRVTHAFHSPTMEPAASMLRASGIRVPPNATTVPFYSTLRGGEIDGADLTLAYWSEQMVRPVDYLGAMRALLADARPSHLIEIGPNGVLTTLARDIDTTGAERLVPMPGPASAGTEFAEVLAALYSQGTDVVWAPLYQQQHRTVRRLPGYRFDHDRHRLAGKPTLRFRSNVPAVESILDDTAVGAAHGGVSAESPLFTTATSVPDELDLETSICTLIAQLGGFETGEFTRSSRLRDDLGFDSIMAVRLGDRVNELLAPTPPIAVVDLADNLDTVGNLVDFVRHHTRTYPHTVILEGAN